MKLWTILALIASSTGVYAQIEPRPVIDPQAMTQRNMAEIKKYIKDLTSMELGQLLTIERDYFQNVYDAFESTNIDNDAIHNQVKQYHTDRDDKVRSVLNNDQFTQYLKMEAADESKWKGNPNNNIQ